MSARLTPAQRRFVNASEAHDRFGRILGLSGHRRREAVMTALVRAQRARHRRTMRGLM